MRLSQRTLRITAASALALSFVGLAYVLSGPSLFTRQSVNAESTEELLAAYAAKDTDGDTLPDWQEALYGTDPNAADTDGDGISDGEAARQGLLTPNALASQLPEEPTGEDILAEIPVVDPAPGSITEQFSHAFLEAYAAASNGAPMTEETQQALVSRLMQEFSGQAAAMLTSSYTLVSVRTDASLSVTAYAGAVEQLILEHNVKRGEEEPLKLMKALVEDNDESARAKLETLAEAYSAIAQGLLQMPAPPTLAQEHLALIRSFDSLGKATAMIADYESDPIGTMGSLSLYQPASRDLRSTFKNMAIAILSTGEPVVGEPGSMIVNIARSSENTP